MTKTNCVAASFTATNIDPMALRSSGDGMAGIRTRPVPGIASASHSPAAGGVSEMQSSIRDRGLECGFKRIRKRIPFKHGGWVGIPAVPPSPQRSLRIHVEAEHIGDICGRGNGKVPRMGCLADAALLVQSTLFSLPVFDCSQIRRLAAMQIRNCSDMQLRCCVYVDSYD